MVDRRNTILQLDAKVPQKILMTADTVGGVWTYSLELTRALSPQGIQVFLATMGQPLSASQWQEAKKLDNLTILESSFQLEWMNDPWDDVEKAGQWLLQLESELMPDLIHLNGYTHGHLPWQAPVVMVAHSCVCSWWEAVKKEKAPASWNEYRRRVQQGLEAADVVVAPSKAMLQAINRHYGIFSNQHVIYNGTDSRNFYVAQKEPLIASVGRLWDEAKNVEALCRVASRIQPWQVHIAGEAKHPNRDESICHEHVHLEGQLGREELRNLLARASIYALPARYEPFGLSVLEAALSGCVLVLGDIDSLREMWYGAALFVEPDNEEQLERTIRLLESKPVWRNDMAANARKRALFYSATRMANQYLQLYSTLMETYANPVPGIRENAA